ncbi:MAG: histidine kinase [Candidatus Saccharibacteria bacterium]|nr:histidine kinase [Candidatus Saccharibacteria bacterium]
MTDSPPIGISFGELLFILLLFVFVCAAALFIFQEKLYSRLSVRIAILILASGVVTFIMALTYNEITRDTLSTPGERLLQISLIVLGGPVVIGLLAARFVRRPLRQFNKAVASLEQSNYKVQLRPSGIHEFDEVFTKFNNLIHRLQTEEKLRKDLVSDTSHELNTPLTTMIGQLTAMQEGKYLLTKERVDILKEQAERLAELVKQLDAYTKARMLDTSKSEEIHLKQFCEEHIDHFSLELEQKGIVAKLHIAEDYTINANRGTLHQILTNLMQNTLRYSQGTEVTIEVTAHKLLFSDNGRGVPAKSLPYLFERFYRVDKSRNRTTGGLGLGLAIVRELAEQQGWHIHAKLLRPGIVFILDFEE